MATLQPDPDGAGPLESPATQYVYNAVGDLLTLTDPDGNTTTWVYDDFDRVVEERNALDASRYFSYDRAGKLLTQRDRDGRVTTYQYDNLDRPTTENWLDLQQNVVRTFSYTYDAAGQMLTASDPSAAYAYAYDTCGQATTITQTLAGLAPTVVLAQQFDVLGRRTQVAATIGGTNDFVNDYAYDALGQMTSVAQHGLTGGNAVAEKRVALAYNAAGQYSSITRYADLAATQLVVQSDYTFDAAGRLTGLSHHQGSNALAGYAWSYDFAGRTTQLVSVLDGTASYSYDTSSQLVGADYDYQSDESYAYDANGNRINASNTTGTNNQLLSDGTFNYTYDAEGNRTSRTRISQDPADDYTTQYTWDYRNRLTAVTFKNNEGQVTKEVQYAYDYQNRLIGKTVLVPGSDAKKTAFVYDGAQIALQFDGTGSGDLSTADLSHRYLYGPAIDQVLADEQLLPAQSGTGHDLAQPGSVVWPLADNLGTVRDLAQYDPATGTTTVVNHRVYDAFGQLTSQTNAAVDCLFGYTGQVFDADSGLSNYRARWYDASTGRFLSQDPSGFFLAGDANLYRYVSNAPLSFTDPTGLCHEGDTPASNSPQSSNRDQGPAQEKKEIIDKSDKWFRDPGSRRWPFECWEQMNQLRGELTEGMGSARWKYWNLQRVAGWRWGYTRPSGYWIPGLWEHQNAIGVFPNPETNPNGEPFVLDYFHGYNSNKDDTPRERTLDRFFEIYPHGREIGDDKPEPKFRDLNNERLGD